MRLLGETHAGPSSRDSSCGAASSSAIGRCTRRRPRRRRWYERSFRCFLLSMPSRSSWPLPSRRWPASRQLLAMPDRSRLPGKTSFGKTRGLLPEKCQHRCSKLSAVKRSFSAIRSDDNGSARAMTPSTKRYERRSGTIFVQSCAWENRFATEKRSARTRSLASNCVRA